MSAKETASGEKHRMKENGENRAIVREDDRMTHRGQQCLFLCEPACVRSIHACPTVCIHTVPCSVIAASVATEVVEPHRGQPCKEHKRPI